MRHRSWRDLWRNKGRTLLVVASIAVGVLAVGMITSSNRLMVRQMGRAQGVFQSLNNGAVLLAGLWAGALWKVGSGNGRVPLVASGAVAAVAAIAMFVVALNGRRRVAV